MRAFIYTAGNICPENITERPKDGDLVIAADAGYLNAKKCGVTPDLLLGDFDSFDLPEDLSDKTEVIQFPPEKYDTDPQLAVRAALERRANEIVIIGGLDGRLDHTLSLLAILEDLDARHIHALVTSGMNRARFLRNNSTLIPTSQFRYLSLIAADPAVKGVTVEGCKYPLQKARLSRRNQYAISNELVGNCALIDVRRGGVWVIESCEN